MKRWTICWRPRSLSLATNESNGAYRAWRIFSKALEIGRWSEEIRVKPRHTSRERSWPIPVGLRCPESFAKPAIPFETTPMAKVPRLAFMAISWKARHLLVAVGLMSTSARASSLSLDRGPVVLGRTESVGVTIRVEEPPGSEERPLRLAVNVGSFSEITRVSRGVYRSAYVPPSTLFPQVALVAVWRETGPQAPIDFLRIPLYGATKIPVSAKPGSEVRLTVGIDDFGPVVVDAQGKSLIPANVAPGIQEATVHVQHKGVEPVTRKLPIEVPPYNRLTAAAVPHALTADGRSWARLDVFYDLGGVKFPPDRMKVKASIGSVAFIRAERGRYVYRFTPPLDTSAKEAKFTITLEGDPIASASASVRLGLPPANRAILKPPELALPADGHSTAPVSLLLLDAAGLGVPGARVDMAANGRPLPAALDKGDGTYESSFTAPVLYPPGGLIQFTARISRERQPALSALANYQLTAAAVPGSVTAQISPDPVPADGRTKAAVTLDVRDRAGLPLKNAQLLTVASHGTLGPLTEVGDGLYEASYTAPRRLPSGDAVVRVVDSAGSFDKSIDIPLRDNPHRLLIGAVVGLEHNLGDSQHGASGPRPLGAAAARVELLGRRLVRVVRRREPDRGRRPGLHAVECLLRAGRLEGWLRNLCFAAPLDDCRPRGTRDLREFLHDSHQGADERLGLRRSWVHRCGAQRWPWAPDRGAPIRDRASVGRGLPA